MVIDAKQKMFNFYKCFEVCSLQSSWLQGFRNLNLWNLSLKFVPIYLQYILLYLSHLRPNFQSDAERKMFKFNFQANLIALLIKLNCNKPFVFQTFLYLDLDCSLNCLVIFSGVQLCSTQTQYIMGTLGWQLTVFSRYWFVLWMVSKMSSI